MDSQQMLGCLRLRSLNCGQVFTKQPQTVSNCQLLLFPIRPKLTSVRLHLAKSNLLTKETAVTGQSSGFQIEFSKEPKFNTGASKDVGPQALSLILIRVVILFFFIIKEFRRSWGTAAFVPVSFGILGLVIFKMVKIIPFYIEKIKL